MERRRARGDDAEEQAVKYLEREGYRIRDRNVLCRVGELDIVAEKGELICVVEVRMRSNAVWGDPSNTITFGKQRKVVKAAMYYLTGQRLWGRRAVRFDVISVVGRGDDAHIEHIPNAFDAGFW